MTDLPALIAAFTTLFIIIDPMGLSPIFLALTSGMTTSQRRIIAVRACLIGAVLMLAFLFLGEALLGFIGISMPAFRIAGGVLLFLTALEMLFQKRQERREDNVSEIHHADDPSVFPLAMPLIVGPGAITTIILLAGQAEGAADMAAIAAVMFLVLLSVLLAFLVAPVLERLLGKTGLNILTRILGMLLAALAVQFILDGLLETFGMAA
ncbi:MAG: MarC family protein [Yoonia sp.]|nr:MarC family protein [Yoonia sp.]